MDYPRDWYGEDGNDLPPKNENIDLKQIARRALKGLRLNHKYRIRAEEREDTQFIYIQKWVPDNGWKIIATFTDRYCPAIHSICSKSEEAILEKELPFSEKWKE